MINLPVNVDKARLPAAYTQARAALAKCEHIDECKTWADKAAALASYAKQAKDESLHVHARRIQSRAIRRAGELLKAIEPVWKRPGGTRGNKAAAELVTRSETARKAGLSAGQQRQAFAVASVPPTEFEALVESEAPPPIELLVERGTKKRKPKPRKLRRATVANSVDPLFLKISELAALMDKRSAHTILAETKTQFDSGVGLDHTYVERLTFVRDWLDEVVKGSKKFVVTCSPTGD